jgi:hypothetical protein
VVRKSHRLGRRFCGFDLEGGRDADSLAEESGQMEGETMKYLSLGAAVLGALVFLVAVYGKLAGIPLMTLGGLTISGQGLVLVANSFLLFGIFLHLLSKG